MKIKLCPECSEGFRRLSIALGVAGYLFLIQYYILEDIKHDFQYDMYWGCKPYTPLAGERLQPLGHVSVFKAL